MRQRPSIGARSVLIAALAMLIYSLLAAPQARAQLQFTEVMFEPHGDDDLWEWVEVRNTSAAAVDLDGWIFDDEDDDPVTDTGGNIQAVNGNTIIPAGGVAVLYAGSNLNYMPNRFTDAWGSGINLIPVTSFTSLTSTDAIGLWPNHTAYAADTIPMATTSPRRTFAGAVATLDYSMDFPSVGNNSGKSIAWNGSGSPTNAVNWVASQAGDGGGLGPLGEITSTQTVIASSPINNTADRGNPGVVPSSPAAAGLLITEIMYAPATPLATAGWTSNDFEWVEIYNHTAAPIDFAATHYVFDDFVGSLTEANIDSGTLAVGEVGILYNAEMLTEDNMVTMWGADKNYIPVTVWPALNNAGGDTIALWDSFTDYENEPIDGDDHRAHASAVAAVIYNTTTTAGWPAQTPGRSIFLNNLAADPNSGTNWTKAGTTADTLGSFNAAQFSDTAIDHPGGDVGSPGFVPSSGGGLPGDFNHDNRVDATDYTIWRDNFPGVYDTNDYTDWKNNFGATAGAGSLDGIAVPEPACALLLSAALAGMSARLRRREGHQLFAHCFDLGGGELRKLVGKTD